MKFKVVISGLWILLLFGCGDEAVSSPSLDSQNTTDLADTWTPGDTDEEPSPFRITERRLMMGRFHFRTARKEMKDLFAPGSQREGDLSDFRAGVGMQ